MKRWTKLGVVLGAAALGGAYLAWWPVAIEPMAWKPPPPVALEGPWVLNDRLAQVEWRNLDLIGPEAITFDLRGRPVTGLRDGRVVRLSTSGAAIEELTQTGGRPLGLEYDREGRLYICDADRGLLALEADGTLKTLVVDHDGVKLRFTDDLDIGGDGTVYFTDASARHPIARFTEDILEHQQTGRLLSYSPRTSTTALLLDGLSFANGVALGPEESFVAVTETASYRIHRVWLRGPKAGSSDLLIESLPGFPDNLSWDPARKVFWVAIGSPRNRMVDWMAPHPALRKVVARLPKSLQPAPERHALVVAIGPDGRVVEALHHLSPHSYSPIASVVERDGWLYLGSFAREGWARVKISVP